MFLQRKSTAGSVKYKSSLELVQSEILNGRSFSAASMSRGHAAAMNQLVVIIPETKLCLLSLLMEYLNQ